MPSNDSRKQFKIEDADIIFRNFAGEKRKFNDEGKRNFCVRLSRKVAEQMDRDGWNIKFPDRRNDEEGEEAPDPYIQVKVNFDNKPPNITMITNAGKTRTRLNKNNVEILDATDIATCDLICTGYEWDVQGKQGVTAYLKTLFVVVDEDDLELKYAHIGSDDNFDGE